MLAFLAGGTFAAMSSIPIVPNSDRISTASLSASTGPVTVGFPVFGGADDLSVFVDGVLIDAADWTLTSFSGLNVASDTLPAGDGRVTFDNAQTGDVEVIGEVKPKRLSQFTPGVGIGAESFNLTFSVVIATLRELYAWGRASLKLAPGDRAAALPDAATRAGKVLSFSDPDGDPETTIPVGDIANAAGYASAASTAANNAQQAESNIVALLAAADFTYYGSGVPNDAFGSNGDVYVNTAHARWSVYGPKAGGAWGSIVGYMFGEDGTGTGDVSAASNITDATLVVGDGGGKGIKGHSSGAPGDAAFKNTGSTAGTVAAGDDSRFTNAASTSVVGHVELADTSETSNGTDTGRAVTPDGLAGSIFGEFIVSILVFDDSQDVVTGDGAGDIFWRIPQTLNGMDLVRVAAQVQTAGTTGTTDVQVARKRLGGSFVDVLTTKITIDSTEVDTSTAATPAVIDTSNDDVQTGDQFRIDVDAVSTTKPKGLTVELTFRLP